MGKQETLNPWWFFLIGGLLYVTLGLLLVVWPALTLLSILWVLGLFLIVDGIIGIIAGIINIFRYKAWGLRILGGILALIIGVLIYRHPGITAEFIFVLVGIYFLIRGAADLFLISDLHVHSGRAISAISGIFGIIIAILLFCSPLLTSLVLIWVIGIFALIDGALLIGLAISVYGKEKSD
jgi:uncharacterized membrane protein HdeD (DUF308 family)